MKAPDKKPPFVSVPENFLFIMHSPKETLPFWNVEQRLIFLGNFHPTEQAKFSRHQYQIDVIITFTHVWFLPTKISDSATLCAHRIVNVLGEQHSQG